jgi:hypothetical protein
VPTKVPTGAAGSVQAPGITFPWLLLGLGLAVLLAAGLVLTPRR